jgi:NAD(P)-dependent dehydrogenase (short-subunit alcohol dehydrogenase family)
MDIRFDGRVAIVTGAGGGLGRDYALDLAARGAKVIVNDLGVGKSDNAADSTPAAKVVAEIVAGGGEAIANYDSVAEPESAKKIVQAALDAWGRVDILINNAGILRDKSFAKADLADIDLVMKVHLNGSIYMSHAVWPHMLEQGYGRIVFTTSIAGYCGNFGQTGYSAAKMGLIGVMNTLKIEGGRKGVLINTISPGAVTRMTEGLNPPAIEKYMTSERVAPVVTYFASEQCKESGLVVEAMAGGISRMAMFETDGVQLDPEAPITAETVAQNWGAIIDPASGALITHGAEGRIEPRLRAIGRWVE